MAGQKEQSRKDAKALAGRSGELVSPAEGDFEEVVALIDAARLRAIAAVNHELVGCTGRSASTSAARSSRPRGGTGWSSNSRPTSPGRTRRFRGSTVGTCSGCDSSTRPTGATRKCHRW